VTAAQKEHELHPSGGDLLHTSAYAQEWRGRTSPPESGSGIAKEGAVHAITANSTTQITQSAADAAVPPLHSVAQVGAQPAAGGQQSQGGNGSSTTRAIVVGPDARSLQVHYEFDRVANLWVANLLDPQNGEVVRTVPATRVLHQLAELTHPRVDTHA
jgi:hypothetical protein